MDPFCRRTLLNLLLVSSLLWLAGCKVTAPVHLWKPPVIASAVGSRVVVSEVAGDSRMAKVVREKLFDFAPNEPGQNVSLVDYRTLTDDRDIQLVSAFDDEVNDVALASVARRSGADFLLRGEVFQRRSSDYQESLEDQLTISWRLTSLVNKHEGGGIPVSVTTKAAIERYPDLALLSSPAEILPIAAVRETYKLMLPTVIRETIELENAYVLPWSRELRKANAMAEAGRWSEAERLWKEVKKKNPFQIAAIHNLAIAAVARQDFSSAKKLASQAVRLHPSALHQRTLVWVETRQRNYHAAFGYADPPEGWFLTRGDVGATSSPSVSTRQ